MDTDVRPIIRHRYQTLEELTAHVRQWELDFRQLTSDVTISELTQIALGPVTLTHVSTGCNHIQQGASPEDAYTFALLVDGEQSVHWCGRLLSINHLPIFAADGAFEASAYPQFRIFTLSVKRTRLDSEPIWQRFLKGSGQANVLTAYNLSAEPKAMAGLRGLVSNAFRISTSRLFLLTDTESLTDLGEMIVNALLTVVETTVPVQEQVGISTRSRLVRKALTYIRDRPFESLQVKELCRLTAVSERTLERTFLEFFGVTPKAYLQAFRLNGVRRELLQAKPGNHLVRDIAIRWGFWHMSQFASDYRRLFGELPSQTFTKSLHNLA